MFIQNDVNITDEVYRICEQEILLNSELYERCYYVSINEDSFDGCFTGTAFGAYLEYTLDCETDGNKIDMQRFCFEDSVVGLFDSIPYVITITFHIHVKGEKVTVDIECVDVYDNNNYNEYLSAEVFTDLDKDALIEHIIELAQSTISEIHIAASNIEY